MQWKERNCHRQSMHDECRMQFNQNGPNVEVQVFAKQLNKKRERVTVEIQEKSLRVEIKNDDLSQTEYLLEEDLYQSIDVEGSKWDVWATQVNIKLRKGDPSVVWPSLAQTDVPVRIATNVERSPPTGGTLQVIAKALTQ